MDNSQVASATHAAAARTLKATFAGSPRPQPDFYYANAARTLRRLMALPDLDNFIQAQPNATRDIDIALGIALHDAYADAAGEDEAHLFLHRTLYSINRLKLFWYDDLESYDNERSDYLRSVRERVETAWQAHEAQRHDVRALRALDVETALRDRCAADLNPAGQAAESSSRRKRASPLIAGCSRSRRSTGSSKRASSRARSAACQQRRSCRAHAALPRGVRLRTA